MSNAVITIVGGKDALALTPPLGWNSWNVWGGNVTADHVRAAADGMVTSGLAAQGYTYINIDDAWEAGWRKGPNGGNDVAAGRDANGEILTNEKFPDMKGLVDYIHGKGLKAGIYSGPGNSDLPGAGRQLPARSAGRADVGEVGLRLPQVRLVPAIPSRPTRNSPLDLLQKPYILMRGVLDTLDRDVVFSLCQYGLGQGVGVGRRGRRQSLARHRRHHRHVGRRCRRSASSRPATRSTPGPDTGTTPTCWSSATSAGAASIRRVRPT